jgi:hypothetical protein
MEKLKTVWLAIGEAGGAVAVTLATIATLAVIVHWDGRQKAGDWMRCLELPGCNAAYPQGSEDQALPARPTIRGLDGASAALETSATMIARLNHQLDLVQRRADYHLKVTRDFYVSYYYSLTMALFLGAGAAILLFFVSQKGWKEAEQWQIASFIITTTAAAAFSAFPTLYSQQDNIEQNKELYLHHQALEGEILSFAATGEPLDPTKLSMKDGEKVTATIFVRYIDRRMAELHRLPLGFDYSRLPADYLAGVPAEVKPAQKESTTQTVSDAKKKDSKSSEERASGRSAGNTGE